MLADDGQPVSSAEGDLLFQRGCESFDSGDFAAAIAIFKECLDNTAEQHLERCAAMRWIAKAYQESGEPQQAQSWLYRAVAEAPETREPYLDLAMLGYFAGDWHLVIAMTEKLLTLSDENASASFRDEACWGVAPYDLAALGTYFLGLYEKSHQYAKAALAINPADERLARNVDLALQRIRSESGRPSDASLQLEFFDIVFYDDIGMDFNPEILENGTVGGSEFVLCQLAHEFGKRGHRVLVWLGKEGARDERTYGNVVYRYGSATTPVYGRHFIHHRRSSISYESKARWGKRWFFCTDMWGEYYQDIIDRLSPFFDGTLCVSQWQAAGFPAAAKCHVLPNPIPAETYLPSTEMRDPAVFVYASAALKGLGTTLEVWQHLRQEHPHLREARLRVLSPGYDDPTFAGSYDGVEVVGAVPFQQLRDELRRAAGLFYANDFPETFCIVAAAAEACGARVHIWMRNGGAIRETVNSPLVVTEREQFESDFVRLYRSPPGAGCATPRDFSTPHVVDLWLELLES